jgi:hypothetical protein
VTLDVEWVKPPVGLGGTVDPWCGYLGELTGAGRA